MQRTQDILLMVLFCNCVSAIVPRKDLSPVFMWGGNAHDHTEEVPFLRVLKYYEFQRITDALLKDYMLVVFIENELEIRDFGCLNPHTQSSCFAYLSKIRPKTFYPQVESPSHVLRSMNCTVTESIVDENSTNDDLGFCESGSIHLLYFADSDTTEKWALLRAHDTIMQRISHTCCTRTLFFFMSMASWEDSHDRFRRQRPDVLADDYRDFASEAKDEANEMYLSENDTEQNGTKPAVASHEKDKLDKNLTDVLQNDTKKDKDGTKPAVVFDEKDKSNKNSTDKESTRTTPDVHKNDTKKDKDGTKPAVVFHEKDKSVKNSTDTETARTTPDVNKNDTKKDKDGTKPAVVFHEKDKSVKNSTNTESTRTTPDVHKNDTKKDKDGTKPTVVFDKKDKSDKNLTDTESTRTTPDVHKNDTKKDKANANTEHSGQTRPDVVPDDSEKHEDPETRLDVDADEADTKQDTDFSAPGTRPDVVGDEANNKQNTDSSAPGTKPDVVGDEADNKQNTDSSAPGTRPDVVGDEADNKQYTDFSAPGTRPDVVGDEADDEQYTDFSAPETRPDVIGDEADNKQNTDSSAPGTRPDVVGDEADNKQYTDVSAPETRPDVVADDSSQDKADYSETAVPGSRPDVVPDDADKEHSPDLAPTGTRPDVVEDETSQNDNDDSDVAPAGSSEGDSANLEPPRDEEPPNPDEPPEAKLNTTDDSAEKASGQGGIYFCRNFVLFLRKLELGKISSSGSLYDKKALNITQMLCSHVKPDNISVSLEAGDTKITFDVLEVGKNYNEIKFIKVNGAKFNVPDVTVPKSKFSYSCNGLVARSANKKALKFTQLQFQVLPETEKTEKFKFADAWTCSSVVTPGILSGLFITALLIGITLFGISMISDIKTNDCFDDPNGESLRIPAD